MQKIYRNLGISYKGSKSKIAEKIVGLLPRAEHFYDLFAGGCAISHCALLKNKYQHIHINDINPMMPGAFIKALQGGFDDEDRWISREDFFRLKDTDPYVAICFSFGNDLKTYCYGKEVEPLKKALHYAIFFDSYELSDALIGVDLRPIRKCATRQEKYLLAKRLIKAAYSNNNTPPQCSKVGKDSDAYRLPSYERQKRTQEIAFQKKKTRYGSTCRTWSASNEYKIQGGLDRTTAHSAAVIRDTAPTPNNYPPPTTSGIGKPRKAA